MQKFITEKYKHQKKSIEIGLFSDLYDEDRGNIEKQFKIRRFKAGQVVLEQKCKSTDVYFVLSGKLIAMLLSFQGKEVAYDDISEGQYFGEISALDGLGRSASVYALQETTIASLSAHQFQKIIYNNPDITQNLIKDLTGRIRRLTDRTFEFSCLPVTERLKNSIVRTALEQGQFCNDGCIDNLPTHAQWGARIGVNREAITRAINSLQKSGLIEAYRQKIVIKNIDAFIDGLHESVDINFDEVVY